MSERQREQAWTVEPSVGLDVLKKAKAGIYAAFEGQGDSPASAVFTAIVGYTNAMLRIKELEEALREVCDDLEAELRGVHQVDAGAVHPAVQHRFDRDMAVVLSAREVLDG